MLCIKFNIKAGDCVQYHVDSTVCISLHLLGPLVGQDLDSPKLTVKFVTLCEVSILWSMLMV